MAPKRLRAVGIPYLNKQAREAIERKGLPPEMTNKQALGWIVLAFGVLIIATATVVGVAGAITGCATPAPDVAAYSAEQIICVEISKTRQEADDCRRAVRARILAEWAAHPSVDAGRGD